MLILQTPELTLDLSVIDDHRFCKSLLAIDRFFSNDSWAREAASSRSIVDLVLLIGQRILPNTTEMPPISEFSLLVYLLTFTNGKILAVREKQSDVINNRQEQMVVC